MTSKAHPTPEELAEFTAGMPAGARANRVRRHLDRCGRCATTAAELTDTAQLLRRVGAVAQPMPPRVERRIMAVLADEADRREASAAPTGRRGRNRLARAFALAATVGVLAIGGGVIYQAISPGQNSPISSDRTGSDRSGEEPGSEGSTNSGSGSDPTTFALAESSPSLTGTDFEADLGATVEVVPERTDAPAEPYGAGEPRGSEPEGQTGDVSLETCIADAAGVDVEDVLDITGATYDGERVMLMITAGDAPGTVHGYVVEACPGSARLLDEAQVSVDR